MWLALIASLSYAQTPGLSLGAITGEARWVVAGIEADRFPNAPSERFALAVGEEVELIFTEGARVRIKQGDRYGWLPATAVTAEAPEIEIPSGLGNPLLSNPLLSTPALQGAPPDLGAGLGAGAGAGAGAGSQ